MKMGTVVTLMIGAAIGAVVMGVLAGGNRKPRVHDVTKGETELDHWT